MCIKCNLTPTKIYVFVHKKCNNIVLLYLYICSSGFKVTNYKLVIFTEYD